MYIGIDLGGTNIAVGVVTDAGEILAQDSVPTLAEREYPEIVKDMAMLCERVAKEAGCTMQDIKAIGIGCPGSIDRKNGIVSYANNLKMDHTPLAAELQKYFDLPVQVENDANAAAFGEYMINGEGVDHFIFITLGTGVGGGIIINKEIYSGFNGAGGELGHFTLVFDGEPCTCGNAGCWEAYASVTALIRQTKAAMEKNPDSLIHSIVAQQGKVNGRTAFDAAKQGDKAAQEVVDTYVSYVAAGVMSMINIFQPEKFVIGGGISKEGDRLLKPIIDFV
ncbi:MAG TPA: ROK family protein, partial [Candidatus Avimonoglobus intestinipullorum]|nr:ROK family protein [Candidatus Avimonoglobus intestinipullorum]